MTTTHTVLDQWSDEATATWLVLVDDAIRSEDQAQIDRLAAAWEAAMDERYPNRGDEIPIVSAREYGIIAGIALEHLDDGASLESPNPDSVGAGWPEEQVSEDDFARTPHSDGWVLDDDEDPEPAIYDPDTDDLSPAEQGWPESEPGTEDPNGVIFGDDSPEGPDLDRWPETGFGD